MNYVLSLINLIKLLGENGVYIFCVC